MEPGGNYTNTTWLLLGAQDPQHCHANCRLDNQLQKPDNILYTFHKTT